MTAPATQFLERPGGVRLEYLVTGAGEPVTLFLHGLAGGIPDTRPLGSGVPGSKVFLHLRGHGHSSPLKPDWGYAELAGDVAAVADATGATRALGVSLGAGALCRLLVDAPDRFARLVFFLPSVLDRERSPTARAELEALASVVASGDGEAVARTLALEVPAALRADPAANAFIDYQTRALLAPGLAGALPGMVEQVAVDDLAALGRVGAPALVLGCRGDRRHPAQVAARLAAALPHSTLHVYAEPGVLWNHRADLRRRISSFLAG